MKVNRILQVGNFMSREGYDNPNGGRVYSGRGIAPTICTMGGGNLEPKVLIVNETD